MSAEDDERCTIAAREYAATVCPRDVEMTPFVALLARTQFEDERAAYRASRAAYRAFVEAQR